MKAILNEDDHERNTRWSKQVASSLVKISAADDWLFSLYSLSWLETRRGEKKKTTKTAEALHRIGPSYLLIKHKALLKLLSLLTVAGVDNCVRTGL